MKPTVLIGALVIVIAGALVYKRSVRQDELAAARAEQERQERQRVDLSQLPPAPQTEEAKPTTPKFGKKPIVVEMKLKQKNGKPFRGKYKLLNAGGDTVGEDAAPSNGDPAVFIVTPGHYQLLVPGTKFKKDLALTGGSDGKMEMSVVVNH